MIKFTCPLDPTKYPITRDFYYQSSFYVGGQHAAVDFGAPAGTPILATAGGVVIGVGWDMYSGFFVALEHVIDGVVWRSFYRHLYGQTPLVVGQKVVQGQIVGNVGSTGWSTGPHLHFDLWCSQKIRDDEAIFYKNGWYAVDPLLYLGIAEKGVGIMPLYVQDEKGRHILIDAGVANVIGGGKGEHNALKKTFAYLTGKDTYEPPVWPDSLFDEFVWRDQLVTRNALPAILENALKKKGWR